jgi:hypothetical protein
MTMVAIDRIVGLAAAAIGVAMLALIEVEVPGETLGSAFQPGSSAFLPGVAGVSLVICGALLTAKAFSGSAGRGELGVSFQGVQRLLCMVAILGAYTVAINLLGMLSSTALMVVGVGLAFGYRSFAHLLLLAVGTAAAIHLLFERALLILMPRGWLL